MKILNRIISAAITFLLVMFACCAILPSSAFAAKNKVISETLNIADARRNLEGPGYTWANRYSELTLDGVNIDTKSAYGLRLPKDCTVILKGENYIKAEKYGISCSGTVVFKGEGSLTIEAGNTGIFLVSQNHTHKIRLIDGKYTITAGEYGVYSEYADFSFVGNSMSISTTGENGYAISGRCVNLLGGSFTANASVTTSQELVVDGINIDIESDRTALSAPILRVDNIDIEGADVYSGENTIKGTALKRFNKTSIIFGEDVDAWVDYVILAVFALGVAAAIILPVIHKKKKNSKIHEQLVAEGYLSE